MSESSVTMQRERRAPEGLALIWPAMSSAIRYGFIVGFSDLPLPPLATIMNGQALGFAVLGIPAQFTGAVDLRSPIGEERQYGLVAYRADGSIVPVPGVRFVGARGAPRDREYHLLQPPELVRPPQADVIVLSPPASDEQPSPIGPDPWAALNNADEDDAVPSDAGSDAVVGNLDGSQDGAMPPDTPDEAMLNASSWTSELTSPEVYGDGVVVVSPTSTIGVPLVETPAHTDSPEVRFVELPMDRDIPSSRIVGSDIPSPDAPAAQAESYQSVVDDAPTPTVEPPASQDQEEELAASQDEDMSTNDVFLTMASTGPIASVGASEHGDRIEVQDVTAEITTASPAADEEASSPVLHTDADGAIEVYGPAPSHSDDAVSDGLLDERPALSATMADAVVVATPLETPLAIEAASPALATLLDEAELYLLPHWVDHEQAARILAEAARVAPADPRLRELEDQLRHAQEVGTMLDEADLQQEAQRCMEAHEYWRAVDLYEQILAGDNENEAARRGSTRARQMARWSARMSGAAADAVRLRRVGDEYVASAPELAAAAYAAAFGLAPAVDTLQDWLRALAGSDQWSEAVEAARGGLKALRRSEHGDINRTHDGALAALEAQLTPGPAPSEMEVAVERLIQGLSNLALHDK